MLIIIGQDIVSGRPNELSDFIVSRKIKCHVMSNVWALQTNDPPTRVLEDLARYFGPKAQFVVAPIANGWIERNATSRTTCFP
jgi:hypothetical protein